MNGAVDEKWVPRCRSCMRTAGWHKLKKDVDEAPCTKCGYMTNWRALAEVMGPLDFLDQIHFGLRDLRFKDPDDAAAVEGAKLVDAGRKVRFSFTLVDGHIVDIEAKDAGPLMETEAEPGDRKTE